MKYLAAARWVVWLLAAVACGSGVETLPSVPAVSSPEPRLPNVSDASLNTLVQQAGPYEPDGSADSLNRYYRYAEAWLNACREVNLEIAMADRETFELTVASCQSIWEDRHRAVFPDSAPAPDLR